MVQQHNKPDLRTWRAADAGAGERGNICTSIREQAYRNQRAWMMNAPGSMPRDAARDVMRRLARPRRTVNARGAAVAHAARKSRAAGAGGAVGAASAPAARAVTAGRRVRRQQAVTAERRALAHPASPSGAIDRVGSHAPRALIPGQASCERVKSPDPELLTSRNCVFVRLRLRLVSLVCIESELLLNPPCLARGAPPVIHSFILI